MLYLLINNIIMTFNNIIIKMYHKSFNYNTYIMIYRTDNDTIRYVQYHILFIVSIPNLLQSIIIRFKIMICLILVGI